MALLKSGTRIYGNLTVDTFITATGNITAGNIATAGNVVISGNVTTASGTNANLTIDPDGTGNLVVTSLTPAVFGNSLSVGTTLSVTGNVSTGGAILPRVVTITDGTSVTINGNTTDIAVQTNTQVAGTLTINAVTGSLFNGQKIIFRLQSANIQTFSWDASFEGSVDLPLPTASTGSNRYDYVGFIYNTTATKWQLLAKNFGFV